MYVPQNLAIFTAAFAGAIAGMGVSGKVPTNQASASYAPLSSVAGAFAQQFDTVWGSVPATESDAANVEECCEAAWQNRTPNAVAPFLTPATYDAQCKALVAIVQSGKSYFQTQGITSPIVSGGAVTQPSFYVNAATGNDANSGATTGTALKTLKELGLRLARKSINITVTVFLLSSFVAADPLNLADTSVGVGGKLIFIGTRTAVRNGTVTAFTAVDRALNTETLLEDAAVVDWTPDSGLATSRRVRNTTVGPNLDQIVFVAADNLGGVASTDVPYKPSFAPAAPSPFFPSGSLTPGVFDIGDTYVVESLSGLSFGTLEIQAQVSSFPFGGVFFQDLDIQGILAPLMSGNGFATFIGCHFSAIALITGNAETTTVSKCSARASIACIGGIADINSGLFGPNPLDGSGLGASGQFGLLRIDQDATCWGCPIKVGVGGIAIGTAAAFNAPMAFGSGSGLQIGTGALSIENLPSGSAALYTQGAGMHALYGKGNADAGVAVGPGSVFTYQTSPPTITGAGGDFKLGSGGTERAFDETAGAYTAVIAATWADLAIATPAGFGGNAHDLTSEAHLLAAV